MTAAASASERGTAADQRGAGRTWPARAPSAAGAPLPPHPGSVLESEFLEPRRITQQALASALGISRRRVNELIRGHRGITADTAIRLGSFFGNAPEYWMHLQSAWDLHRALASHESAVARR
jgi:addiction module HigA family antidote